MSEKKYRAGIIGCGRIAHLFAGDNKRKGVVTHAQAYIEDPDTELVAVCDVDKDKVEDFGKKWGTGSLYTDHMEMLEKENLDIVSVCTPPSSHFEIANNAISSDVKAVFCEKPISFSLEEGDNLIALARENNTVFAVNHLRRWDPFMNRVAEYIRGGELGEIRSVDCYYTAGICNTGTHMIDLVRMLTGAEIKTVRALKGKEEKSGDFTIDAVLGFTKGFNCFFHGLDIEDYLMFEIDIIASKGRIRLFDNTTKAELWIGGKSQAMSGYNTPIKQDHAFGERQGTLIDLGLRKIIRAIEDGNDDYCNAEDGLKAMEGAISIIDSFKENGIEKVIPLKNRELTIGSL